MVLMRSKDKDVGYESLDKISISLCNRERIRKNRRLLLFCGNIIIICILITIIGFFFLCVIILGIVLSKVKSTAVVVWMIVDTSG